MATIEQQLNAVLTAIETQNEKLEEVSDKLDQLQEAVSNLGLPGSGYTVFDTAEED